MKHFHVVAAVIHKDGKYFCVQKGQTKYAYTSFRYEFPGGKIEEGETSRQALERELIEELNYKISVGERITTVEHTYPDFRITMEVFRCEAISDHFTLTEHVNYKWLTTSELASIPWAVADEAILRMLT